MDERILARLIHQLEIVYEDGFLVRRALRHTSETPCKLIGKAEGRCICRKDLVAIARKLLVLRLSCRSQPEHCNDGPAASLRIA